MYTYYNVFLELIKCYITKSIADLNKYDQIEWDKIFITAHKHNIIPIIYESACKTSSYKFMDNKFKDYWRHASVVSVTAQVKQTYTFLNIYEKLIKEGITALVLKGLVCRNLYNYPDHRYSADEDIYIPLDQYELCNSVFLKSGYKKADKSKKQNPNDAQEITYYSPDNCLHIEVHFNPFGMTGKTRSIMNEYFRDSFLNYIDINIESHTIYTLSHTEHFLFLFLHLYKHMLASGIGIRQVIDMLLYAQEYFNEIDWETVMKSVVEMKGETLLYNLIDIGNNKLEIYIDKSVIPFVKVKAGIGYNDLLMDILESGAFGHADNTRSQSGGFTVQATRDISENNTDRFLLIKALFPDPGFLRASYPLLKKSYIFLPYIWLVRIIKYINRSEIHMSVDCMRISKKRIKMFKELGIL